MNDPTHNKPWYFIAIFCFGCLLGIITDHIVLCMIIGLALFVAWQYRLNATATHAYQQYETDPAHDPDPHFNLFQNTIGALPDAVIVVTEQGSIEWANSKAFDYMGIRYPNDVGLRLSNLVRYPELIAYLNNEQVLTLEKRLQITSPINNNQQLEVRICHYGKHQRLLIIRDITIIARVNQMQQDFIVNASHELRTPLTVIVGYLESFVSDTDCPNQWQPYLEQMRSQTARMQYLINDLMRLSILEITADNITKEIVPVSDLLTDIVLEAKSLSQFTGHQITLETTSDLCLKATQQDIYSALSNLIFNAVQYTPAGGVIAVRWYEDELGAHCSVRDNGFGIAPQHIPRLTERFYRIDKGRSRQAGGTGLGLSIVAQALARHGGQLYIDSTLNEGSLFRCDFPKGAIVYP